MQYFKFKTYFNVYNPLQNISAKIIYALNTCNNNFDRAYCENNEQASFMVLGLPDVDWTPVEIVLCTKL